MSLKKYRKIYCVIVLLAVGYGVFHVHGGQGVPPKLESGAEVVTPSEISDNFSGITDQ